MAAHDGALPGTRVRVTRAGDHLVVRLGSRFTGDDLDVVRRIRGRRWLPDERAWLLPDTQEAMPALVRGFGPRLHGDAAPAGAADGTTPGAAGTVADGPAPAAPTAAPGSAAGPGGAATPAAPAGAAPEAAPGVEAPPEEEAVAVIRQAIRLREYSRRTEQSYVAWVQRYYAFLRRSGRTAMTPRMDEASAVAFLLKR